MLLCASVCTRAQQPSVTNAAGVWFITLRRRFNWDRI